MKEDYKVLTERDLEKKTQAVYTLTPGDLRFLLTASGIKKERIEMAHVCRGGHEWLRVTIDDEDGHGSTSTSFPLYGDDEE